MVSFSSPKSLLSVLSVTPQLSQDGLRCSDGTVPSSAALPLSPEASVGLQRLSPSPDRVEVPLAVCVAQKFFSTFLRRKVPKSLRALYYTVEIAETPGAVRIHRDGSRSDGSRRRDTRTATGYSIGLVGG